MAEAGPKLLRGLLEVFLLESLEQSPKHGYALLKEMGETFGAQPNRNRLYPLLAKLVADGFIREVGEPGGNRTLYALAEPGHEALRAYRRLPPAFRHALRRIWAEGGPAPRPAPAPQAATAAEDADSARRTSPAPGDEARTVPVQADAPSPAPYPCPDATIALEKDARSGSVAIRIAGCPMGAYEYCPECPIYKGVAALVLTSSAKG